MNQSLIRAALKIGAGYFIAKGFTDDATAEIIISGLVALFAVVWGVLQRGDESSTGNKLGIIIAISVAALAFTGCVTPNPEHVRGDSKPAVIVDPQLSANVASAGQTAAAVVPIVASVYPPAAVATQFLTPTIGVIGWLLAFISGLWATRKSNEAKKQEAAAAALAATVPKENHAAALDNAKTNGSTAAVAEHLTASQSPT